MSRVSGEVAPSMAFGQMLRRWARELDLSWTVVPIEERGSEGILRVGYTLSLHARPRGRAGARRDVATLSAPEVRLRALGLCLIGYEHRLAEYRLDVTQGPRPADASRERAPDLDATIRVRLRSEHVRPRTFADPDCAGEVARRLRAFGAPERPAGGSRVPVAVATRA